MTVYVSALLLCVTRVRVQCLEKLLGLSAEDARRVAAAEPALLTFRWACEACEPSMR